MSEQIKKFTQERKLSDVLEILETICHATASEIEATINEKAIIRKWDDSAKAIMNAKEIILKKGL